MNLNPLPDHLARRRLLVARCVIYVFALILVAQAVAGVPTGLVSLWHGDGDAQDSTGTNHGTLIGGAGFAAGVSGQAFRLDGVNFIRVPDSLSLRLTNQLTFVLWFKREDGLAGSAYSLFDKRDVQTFQYGANNAPSGLSLYYLSTTAGFRVVTAPLPIAGVWHHFAGSYRQTNNNVEIIAYVDGIAVGTNVSSGTLAAAVNTVPLAIGSARDGASDYFRGLIDEVALYNYALSPSEVLSNFNSVSLPPPPVFSDFNLSRDFNAVTNPTGVWSYGWKETVGGTLNLLTARIGTTSANGVPMNGWILPGFGQPGVYANQTATTGTGAGGWVAPPGAVYMVPGINGRIENFAAIRFTAPSNSNYEIRASVAAMYTGDLAGDTDFHVVQNGIELFGQLLGAHEGTSFTNLVALNAGDTIDFALGRGADGNEYGSTLRLAALVTPMIVEQPDVFIGGTADYFIFRSRAFMQIEGITNSTDHVSGRLRIRLWASEDHWTPATTQYVIAVTSLPRLRSQRVLNVERASYLKRPPAGTHYVTLTLEERIVDADGKHWQIRDAAELGRHDFTRRF